MWRRNSRFLAGKKTPVRNDKIQNSLISALHDCYWTSVFITFHQRWWCLHCDSNWGSQRA